ncbi:MAG: PAS domain S-box protein [Deltaproteobacteria bacterium]|nr:PAS domain S-box protein [Deltaproteobacteria bacterium]
MVPIKSREELEARIEYLEEINRFTIDALEMAASLGDFQVSINKLQAPQAILRETGARVKRLIPFQTVGFYLIDENNANFSLSLVEPDKQRSLLQKDVDFLIENGTFAWALREKRGVSVSSKDFKRHLLLYVMATYSRIRGLFVGFLRPEEKNIPEVSLSLLSLILLNSANALESFELYRMVQKGRDELEIRVKERTLELAETNAKLQQEIIERERTEKALRESEERYRNLVELSPDAVFIHVDGKYVFGNNAGTKLLGAAKPEDFIGKSIQEIVHPDDWPISRERIREIQKKGREIPHIEEKYIRLDGTAVDVEISSASLVYEGEPAVQVVVRDITERKQAEGALRKSEENYRRLVENAPLGILTINPGGKIVDFNPVLAKTLGFSSTDAIRQMNVFDFSPLLESGIANDLGIRW